MGSSKILILFSEWTWSPYCPRKKIFFFFLEITSGKYILYDTGQVSPLWKLGQLFLSSPASLPGLSQAQLWSPMVFLHPWALQLSHLPHQPYLTIQLRGYDHMGLHLLTVALESHPIASAKPSWASSRMRCAPLNPGKTGFLGAKAPGFGGLLRARDTGRFGWFVWRSIGPRKEPTSPTDH